MLTAWKSTVYFPESQTGTNHFPILPQPVTIAKASYTSLPALLSIPHIPPHLSSLSPLEPPTGHLGHTDTQMEVCYGELCYGCPSHFTPVLRPTLLYFLYLNG